MIRVLIRQQLDEKAFREGRRITWGEVSEKTGISRATLTRLANNPGYKTNTDTIDALCAYFECSPCDLLVRIPDEKEGESGHGDRGSDSGGGE